ncbi:MAG: alpha/beta hydrolase [Synergistaceae bacterium]|nr:alpha/beta hydrolase [Synergistaceae bacterium]
MRKVLAVLLLVGLMAGASSGEEFRAWDLNERIHPQLKAAFEAAPSLNITPESLGGLRKVFTPESLPKDESVEVRDEVTGSGVRVRVYKPKTEQKEFPALLWIHGGGHILGLPEQDEALAIRIAKEAKCIVAAPDYRLAPEHPYPADVDDCYGALVWMTENLPVRKDRVAVAGQSAGGGLTAAVALRARDSGGPALCFQMPLYPMLDCRNLTPSTHQITDHRVWCRDFNVTAWGMYLAGVSGDVPAYASPALADDLSGLPPTYIMVGTLDPFRDEAITYAQRLMQAGVPVELHVIPGATHGFEGIFSEAEVSVRAVNEYVNALAEALK